MLAGQEDREKEGKRYCMMRVCGTLFNTLCTGVPKVTRPPTTHPPVDWYKYVQEGLHWWSTAVRDGPLLLPEAVGPAPAHTSLCAVQGLQLHVLLGGCWE